MTAALTYFEDVVVDNVQLTPAITVTEAHVAMYEGLTREMPLKSGGRARIFRAGVSPASFGVC